MFYSRGNGADFDTQLAIFRVSGQSPMREYTSEGNYAKDAETRTIPLDLRALEKPKMLKATAPRLWVFMTNKGSICRVDRHWAQA